MRILGIHDGHTSTACLLNNGHVEAMASEERFNRIKGYGGAPLHAIQWILEYVGLVGADIDLVALGGISPPALSWEKAEGMSRRRAFNFLTKLLPAALVGSHMLVEPYLWFEKHFEEKRRRADLYEFLRNKGISPEKVWLVEHHQAHTATCYFGAPESFRSKPVLAITVDGSGDGLSGTVSEGREGKLHRLRSWTSFHSLGELYGRVTEILGMKPNEHEYKVMGLAPYAPEELAEKTYRLFRKYVGLSPDGFAIEIQCRKWGLGLSRQLAKDFGTMRFDAVSAGIQRVTEEVVVGLVRNWIRKTGIQNVALAGGVFMNIKLNMLLAELPEIGDLFVFPSCGDESIALGAAYICHVENHAVEAKKLPQPFRNIYLGPSYPEAEIEKSLRKFANEVLFERYDDIHPRLVALLRDGNIIARCTGRMEWGARSLGNRSLLADPRDLRNVRKLNNAIKQRDFWMPFAPSILAERQEDYIENPKKLASPFMMTGFRSKPRAERDLLAALHPRDLTCRPQIVEASVNPGYHRLLSLWERETGVGGLLNTSFNIHGEPIVCSPGDAIGTLVRSGLDFLALEDYLVWRRDAVPKTRT